MLEIVTNRDLLRLLRRFGFGRAFGHRRGWRWVGGRNLARAWSACSDWEWMQSFAACVMWGRRRAKFWRAHNATWGAGPRTAQAGRFRQRITTAYIVHVSRDFLKEHA